MQKRISKDDFVEEMNIRANEYMQGVIDGSIVTNENIKKAVKRTLKDKNKFEFNQKSVDSVFRFFSYINIPQGGKRPSQFALAPWQAWVLYDLYGLYYQGTTKRVRREGLIYIAKKNGKTMFAGAIQLYALVKGEYASESLMVASSSKQAGQCLKYLKQLINDSPGLKELIHTRQYDLSYNSTKKGFCVAKTMANVPDIIEGTNPSFAILDEVHLFNNTEMQDNIRTAMIMRHSPLLLMITTAGFNRSAPLYSQIETAKNVLDGKTEDDTSFYALYELDDEEEIEDIETWIKANPSLGITIQPEVLKAMWAKAQTSETERVSFLTKHLNSFTDGVDTWIEDSAYKECQVPVDIEALKGMDAYIGIDLSANRDFCSIVITVEDEDGIINTIPEFHLPAKPKKTVRADFVETDVWAKDGFVNLHPGKIVDHGILFESIQYWCEFFNVIEIGFDPWNAHQLKERINDEIADICVDFVQNVKYFNPPMKKIEALILSEKIKFGTNPILRWMFRNLEVYTDGNGNIKPMKNKSRDSIDGIIALLIAYGRMTYDEADYLNEAQQAYINQHKQE